jgi:hypothetical protein
VNLKFKTLLAILIVVAVLESALINHLLVMLGVSRERNLLMLERIAIKSEMVRITQELSASQARLCYGYKSALRTTIVGLGLGRSNNPIVQLLVDQNHPVPKLRNHLLPMGGGDE